MIDIHDRLKRCSTECDVSKYSMNQKADFDRTIRDFTKGRSFSFGEWKILTKYTNDDFEQSFVSYNNALLACKRTHISKNPPELIYDQETGMIIGVNSQEWDFVFATGININEYYLGGIPYGLPVFTNEMLTKLGPENYPEKYIKIKDPETDLDGIADNGDTYLNILFSAVRSLQAEVARLKNSFKYGINSYTGTKTALSDNIGSKDMSEIIDEEPLWAVDQSDLSPIASGSMNFETGDILLTPLYNCMFSPGVVKINDAVEWNDTDESVLKLTDPKLYTYITSDSLNINFKLKDLDYDDFVNIDISSLIDTYEVNKYNILFLISRKVVVKDKDEVKDTYGHNYIWISISDRNTNKILKEGYYDLYNNKLVASKSDFGRFTIDTVNFKPMNLYKYDMYSQYQDFSEEVVPSMPSDEDYKYEVAHITIRAVKDIDELKSIESQLLNNELIWNKKDSKLYIKSDDKLTLVGTGGGSSDPNMPNAGMSDTEIIELLEQMGIISVEVTNDSGELKKTLKLSSISDVTFINSDTGKTFKFEVSPEGELVGTELPKKTLEQRIFDLEADSAFTKDESFRGFIAKLLCGESGSVKADSEKDVGLYADRVAISSFYCPLNTDTKFGCSHGYIELENTSNSDIPLDGCYLHFMRPYRDSYEIVRLSLKGILKAGSTYLIRAKKYSDYNLDSNVIINVDGYDQEWYVNGELLDLSIDSSASYGFALTYGKDDVYKDASSDQNNGEINQTTILYSHKSGIDAKKAETWKWYYIDSMVFNSHVGSTPKWSPNVISAKSNSIVRRTFALDPAKQAFNGLTTYDSSRYRQSNIKNDIQFINLNTKEISFPHSDETYPIERYTPKSSKLKKNVSTDKTKMDMEKPNMVTCSFGINAYTTRCFNWVSAGDYDEYVFLKNGSNWIAFESYNTISNTVSESSSYPRRKEFSSIDTNNVIYARMHGKFPGFDVNYTSHKCILNVVENPVSSKTTYTYVVGRMDKNGNPDFDHCSEEYTFTLYPESSTPRFYQITDQQGFHWIEYQVWAASANTINSKIEQDCLDSNIMPVLINTGDMTQNGTRINEWLDYYNAGKSLFKHIEQMNVTGNNDLCGVDPSVLGTGDDVGKSNSYYFHVFYCYEIDENNIPIITGNDGIKRYIPSLYYFDLKDHRILMCNSEITKVTCKDWFKKTSPDTGDIVNIYTGWTVPESTSSTPHYVNGFTSIYTMIYRMLNNNTKEILAVCHEMPFTVITMGSMSKESAVTKNYRSFGEAGSSLIGCHMNQLSTLDTKGIYWFSRLLEYFNVKLCIGGHKHTYAATLPVRELYYWNGGTKNSLDNYSEIIMSETLENDDITWFNPDNIAINSSKTPIVNANDWNTGYMPHSNDELYMHLYSVDDKNSKSGVVYFMCQATGYKLTSNKELPSQFQEFSQLIPETSTDNKAHNSQRYPMFSIIDPSVSGYNIALVSLWNIMTGANDKPSFTFTQSDYSKDPIKLMYADGKENESDKKRFCKWTESDDIKYIVTV